MPFHDGPQCLFAGITQSKSVDFALELLFAAVAPGVAIDARNRRGIDKIAMRRVDAGHFGVQSVLLLEKIFLVIVFGHGKGSQRHYPGVNRTAEFLFQRGLGGFCLFALVLVMVEYCPHILTGARGAGRCMAFPKNINHLSVGDAPRVIVHLNRFRVITDTAIGWVRLAAAGVAHAGADDSVDDPEPGFDAPESPQTERCGFERRRRLRIDGRNCRRRFVVCLIC